jgi:hypothetical protein
MSDFFRELIGIKCDFETPDDSYEGYILKDLSGNWIVIEDENESLYLNLAFVISIRVSEDEAPKKSIFAFGKGE